MKRILYATFLVALVVCRTGWTEESVPHRIFYQSLLEDNDGNLLTDPFVEMEFRILNEENQPVYSEQIKDVQVIDSAVSVPAGDSGGLTTELLDPRSGPKFLDISVNQGKATDTMELGSVPYSIWSEKALGVIENSIGSEEIKDGSIKLEDLADEITFGDISGQIDLSTQVSSTIATDEELTSHIQSTTAHPATAVTVQGPFMQSLGDNVEAVLRDLDQKLSLEMGNRQANNSGEAAARIAADEAQTTALANEITTRSSEDTLIRSDVATLQSDLTTHQNATSAHGSDGAIVGVNTFNGGINNLQNQINSVTTNITDLQGAFEGHRDTSSAHGSNGAVVGVNTLNSTATGLQGQINTANNSISALQSVVSSINNLPGTLSESKIDSAITRDGEVVGIAEGSFVNQGGDTMSGQLNVPSLSVGGDIGIGGWIYGPHIQLVNTGQIVMPRGNDSYVITSDLWPPSDDYIACGAWGGLDALTVNGGGGDFDSDDHWGPGTANAIQGSAVTWGIVGSNSRGSSKAVRIYCQTSGDDAHYACRGFALFARGISCDMPGL